MSKNGLSKTATLLSVISTAIVLAGILISYAVRIALTESQTKELIPKVEKLEEANQNLERQVDVINYRLKTIDDKMEKLENKIDALLKKLYPRYKYEEQSMLDPDPDPDLLNASTDYLFDGPIDLAVLDSISLRAERIDKKLTTFLDHEKVEQ